MLSKLTIIMPTFNRQDYALRNMHFLSGLDMVLHVLDGTDIAIEQKLLTNISDNVHYHHLPISITERLKIASELVKTEYSLMIGDDEFFLISGILKCINEIENSDLVACLGRSLYFNFKDGKILAEPLNHESGSPWHPGFKNYTILESDYKKRILSHMNPYLSVACYAVTKTNIWKTNLLAASACKTSSTDSPEIALEMACAFQGKVKVIDDLMWLRSGENEPQQFLIPEKYLSFGKWYEDPTYKEEVQVFINNLSEVLFNINNSITKIEITNILIKGCRAFSLFERTRRFDLRAWIVNMHLGFKPMRYLIIKRFNQLMQKIGVYRSEEYGLNISNPDLLEMAAVWKKNGIGVDFKEVTEINDLLLKFHNQPK